MTFCLLKRSDSSKLLVNTLWSFNFKILYSLWCNTSDACQHETFVLVGRIKYKTKGVLGFVMSDVILITSAWLALTFWGDTSYWSLKAERFEIFTENISVTHFTWYCWLLTLWHFFNSSRFCFPFEPEIEVSLEKLNFYGSDCTLEALKK